MDLIETLKDNKLDVVGKDFMRLVCDRKYHEARKYLSNLDQDEKDFLRRNQKYNSYLKILSFSGL